MLGMPSELDQSIMKYNVGPMFSVSPITGRRAYDGMNWIPKQKTANDENMTSGYDIVGQPRRRCGTAEKMLELQRKEYETVLHVNRQNAMKPDAAAANDAISAAAIHMAQQDDNGGETVGALETLRRLREVANTQAPPQTFEHAEKAGSASAPAIDDGPQLPTPRARDMTPRVLHEEGPPPATPRSARERTPLAGAGPTRVGSLPPATPNSARSRPTTSEGGARGSLPPATPNSARSRPTTSEGRARAPPGSLSERREDSTVPPTPGSGRQWQWDNRQSLATDERWERRWNFVFGSESSDTAPLDCADTRPATSSTMAPIERRPATSSSLQGQEPPRLASSCSREAQRPSTSSSLGRRDVHLFRSAPSDAKVSEGTGESRGCDGTNMLDLNTKEMQDLLAPVHELDESNEANLEIMAALDIPPPTRRGPERQAYFLQGYSPRRLPPLYVEAKSKMFQHETPQVMVLETPPRSAGGARPTLLGRSDIAGRTIQPQHIAPSQGSRRSSVCAGRPSNAKLPAKPALPNKRPSNNFFIGGKPLFPSKS